MSESKEEISQSIRYRYMSEGEVFVDNEREDRARCHNKFPVQKSILTFIMSALPRLLETQNVTRHINPDQPKNTLVVTFANDPLTRWQRTTQCTGFS